MWDLGQALTTDTAEPSHSITCEDCSVSNCQVRIHVYVCVRAHVCLCLCLCCVCACVCVSAHQFSLLSRTRTRFFQVLADGDSVVWVGDKASMWVSNIARPESVAELTGQAHALWPAWSPQVCVCVCVCVCVWMCVNINSYFAYFAQFMIADST